MPSTVVAPVATQLASVVTGLSVTPAITGYESDPGKSGFPPPAAVVDLPTLRFPDIDESQVQLGSKDWYMEYPVHFYFDLSVYSESQRQAVLALEAFKKAVDANPTLNGTAEIARVVRAEPDLATLRSSGTPVLVYTVTVNVFQLTLG